MPESSVWSITDRYGLPLGMLAVVLIALYKFIWPLLLNQIEGTRKTLTEQLEASQTRLDGVNREFLKALERRDDIMEKGFADLQASIQQASIQEPKSQRKTPRRKA